MKTGKSSIALALFLLLAAPLAGAASVTPSALLAWAQQAYPGLFGGATQDGFAGPYSYRYYAASGIYIGFAGDQVYGLGGPFGSAVRALGALDDFRCTVSPQDCVLSATQQRFEAVTRGSSPSAVFNVYNAKLDGSANYFAAFTELTLASSPIDTAAGVAFTVAHSPVSASIPALPASYDNCPQALPAGTDTTVYPMFDVYLAADGTLAKYCRRYRSTARYANGEVYWSRNDGNGNAIRTFRITVSDTVDITGRNIVGDIQGAGVLPSSFATHLAANAATYPAGSQRVALAGQSQEDYLQVVSFDSRFKEPSALVAVPRSGTTGTTAATIEEALPWASSTEGRPYTTASGSFSTLRGRRVWVASQPTGAAAPFVYRAFVEMSGNVYTGFYSYAGTQNAYYGVYVNPTAKAAVQAANIGF